MSLTQNAGKNYITATSAQYTALPPLFIHYQYKDEDTIIQNKVYWDNNTVNPITAVATGTNEQLSTGLPVAGETVYTPNDTTAQIPRVGQSRNITKITAVAADDGAEVAVNWDMTNDNYFVLVAKSTGTSIACKAKITDSTGSAYSTVTFTTGSVANTWETFVFDFKNNSASNVTITGSPDWSAIEDVAITGDVLSTDATVAMSYGVNDLSQVIGRKISILFSCPREGVLENNLDLSEFKCGQMTKRQIATGRSVNFNLTVGTKNLFQSAVVNGTLPKNSSVWVSEKIYSSEQGKAAISSQTITVPADQKIAAVTVDGRTLQPVEDITLINPNTFFYTSTTMTFDTALNGKVPTVYVETAQSLDNFDVAGLDLGYLGAFSLPKKTQSGKIISIRGYKAQLSGGAESASDDGDTTEVTVSLLADDNNRFFNTATN